MPKDDKHNHLLKGLDASSEAVRTLMDIAAPLLNIQKAAPPEHDAALETSEAKYRGLIEQIPAITFSASFDNGLRDVYVSPQIEDLLGFTADEWLDNPVLWYERLHDEDKKRWNKEFAGTILRGDRFRSIYRFRAKNGRTVWLHGEAMIVKSKFGMPKFIQGVGFDVTEVMEARLRIENAEKSFSRLFETSNDIISTTEICGKIKSLNPAFERHTGFKVKKFLGKQLSDIVHPDDVAPTENIIKDLVAGKYSSATIELRYLCKNKRYIDVEADLYPDVINGDTRGVYLIAREITAKKEFATATMHAKEKLETEVADRTSELQIYKNLVHSSYDAIIIYDNDGKITDWNKQAEKLFGYVRSEVLGRNYELLVPEENTVDYASMTSDFPSRSSAKHYETKKRRKDGKLVDVAVTLSPIVDKHSKTPVGYSKVMRDIRKEKKAAEMFRLAVEAAPAGTIMIDAAGRIHMVNSEAEIIFGYDRKELIGKKIEVLVPDTVRQHHQALRDGFLSRPALRDGFFSKPAKRALGSSSELFGLTKSGKEIPVEIGLNPISTDEGIFVLSTIVDISQRQQSARALQQKSDELQKKSEELEQFVFTVSHDLKSPLVTIDAFAKKLSESLDAMVNEKQRHQLQRIQANVEHMAALLSDLLQLSRVIKKEVDRSPVDVAGIVRSVISTIGVDPESPDITIDMGSTMEKVHSNSRLFAQCMQNLISNAIKYRCESRPLKIRIDTEKIDDAVLVSVTDNGIGIDEKYQEKVFRIFERLDIGEGTGVGLAIVKTIMEKHQGSVTLESQVDAGSRFILKFPDAI